MLDPLYYTCRQKNVFEAIDPNVKADPHEIKEGFAAHEVVFTKRIDEVVAVEQIRDAHITNLEEMAAALDRSVTRASPTWRRRLHHSTNPLPNGDRWWIPPSPPSS
jgi:hypothetical protein